MFKSVWGWILSTLYDLMIDNMENYESIYWMLEKMSLHFKDLLKCYLCN